MPARSTQINIENHSSQDLHGGYGTLQHGTWSVDVPDTISKGQSASMRAESSGVASGDEGRVHYKSGAGDITFHFDNPFVGHNSYDSSGPDSLSFSTSGGEGDNCIVTWTINDKH